jgi:hypothetical protein
MSVLALLLPTIALAYYNWQLPSVGSYHDDGIYLVTAKSMARGGGYRIESLPDQRPQTKYPPAYPLLLSVVWRLFPDFPGNLPILLLVAWLALPITILLLARMLELLGESRVECLMGCLAFVSFHGVLLLAVSLLSDLWFCAAILATVGIAERASEPGAPWRLSLIAGSAAGLAYLTRSSAVILCFTVPAVMLMRREWRKAFGFFLTFAPAAVLWLSWCALHPPFIRDYNDAFYSSYLAFLSSNTTMEAAVLRISTHANDLLLAFGATLIPHFAAGNAADWIRRLVAVAGAGGVVLLVRSGKCRQYSAFAAAYCGLLLLWPGPIFGRYVVPVIPLYAAGLIRLARIDWPSADNEWHSLIRPLTGCLAAVLLLSTYLAEFRYSVYRAEACSAERRKLEAAYRWVVCNTPRDSSFLAFREALLYLYSGRKAEGIHAAAELIGPNDPFRDRLSQLASFARQRGHRYILIGPTDPEFNPDVPHSFLVQSLHTDPTLQLVYSADGVEILEVAPVP